MIESTVFIWQTIIAVLLAVYGGLARLLYLKKNTSLKWGVIMPELIISGFAGIMALKLARAYGLAGDWIGLVCGMAGWFGPRIIDPIMVRLDKVLGIELTRKEEKKDE